MSEYVPQLNPQELFKLYRQGGRRALVDALCVFDSEPHLNTIMEELTDCLVAGFTEQTPIPEFLENMARINGKIHEAVCDLALDEFNDGNLKHDEMTEYINELNETKAKIDSETKNYK